ncbi:MAG: BrnA antitoxin family protein [Verrucomicrobia bacterium]|nr:BrnA antitoxin family protein [Verrucomicrobiota bacterium]
MGTKPQEDAAWQEAKRRGAVLPIPSGKVRITIRLDRDIVGWFKSQVEAAGGGNYQTLLNNALRDHITRRQEPLEKILRRVVREELPAVH